MNLHSFSDPNNFLQALKELFNDLKVPMNYVADEPTTAKELLKDTYKENDSFQLMDDVFFVGMVDDAAFESNKSLEVERIKSDYDGILIFGVTLKQRRNGLLPTRSQLAEISRAFNREFYYTPVVVVFKYGNHLAFANTERLKYKQEWREGEKAGKVSLLRDICIEKPHAGHERILAELHIPTSGTKRVDSFAKLYTYWQEVFSVNLLNKKFYQELSNWYFWATQHVIFPGEPTLVNAHQKNAKLEDLLQEHRATNVIRLLTRLLFVWFVKEKKLIPEELFDLDALQEEFLHKVSPWREGGLFPEANMESIYYKAILQNLFFATLNCPIEGDNLDKRTRGFRGDGFGTHRGIDYLMRYKQYFKNPDAFLEQLNSVVPFLNGGLFECLDDKFNHIYIDGFSDKMTKDEQLIVPDYLFFGLEEQTDISGIIGIKDKKYKRAAVKGLINILKSYKFTITENTPIEEDVALDPELLGKVFENLLASYNPETKTTARKQTGSFYTPREIVNYMVDESLIAYLKNAIKDWGGMDDETLDKELHILTSFDSKVPFADNPGLQQEIITALSTCTILDPACGSGAFPMGILQKMVHILQKLDPDNKLWKEVQLKKARQESEAAFEIEDKQAREERLIEINEAFDQSINDPDYARKLFLIENCIYGVDIQPIATQISKLRFFISLVVEQRVNPEKENFGIRPLPNLETKFVAANTLIGIEKPSAQLSLYDTKEVKALETKLKKVRSKLFSAKSKETKLKYREEDKVLRSQIAEELEKSGWKSDTAQKLAGWDPYDQNASSSFFDSEWMFDIVDGFDIVLGNPPYIGEKGNKNVFNVIKQTSFGAKYHLGRMDYFYFFYHKSLDLVKQVNGVISFITTNYFVTAHGGIKLRRDLKERANFLSIINFNELKIFESAAGQHNMICVLKSGKTSNDEIHIIDSKKKGLADSFILSSILAKEDNETNYFTVSKKHLFDGNNNYIRITSAGDSKEENFILNQIEQQGQLLNDICNVNNGLRSGIDKITDYNKGVFVLSKQEVVNIYGSSTESILKKYYKNSDISKYFTAKETNKYIIYSTKETNIQSFPITMKHLLTVKNQIELKRWKESVPWYALVRARDEKIFISEKIVVPQRSNTNTFGYSDSEWFAGSDVFFITKKTNCNVSIKYLLGLLNSKLFFFWLYHKGKRKGEMLELIGTPLKEIPVMTAVSKKNEEVITLLVNILILKIINNDIQNVLDAIIIELYFPDHMKERCIDVLEYVEKDINDAMKGREFEKLSDAEKEQVIEALHAKWSNPDNEVVKRMAMFKEKSPDILKPIIES